MPQDSDDLGKGITVDKTEPLFQKDLKTLGGFLPSQKHDSYICWTRETYLCEQLDKILFVLVDGTRVPCTCKCHRKV